MSSFTRYGACIWNWDPFISLVDENGDPDYAARNLWNGIYTSPHSKRGIPGLFIGDISTMALAARMPFTQAHRALQRLIDARLVEYDAKWAVLRMTVLPDAGEWPFTATILTAWWKRFQDMPVCDVRDAHVATLRSLVDRGAREAVSNKSKKPSDLHEEIWMQTFGTIRPPKSYDGNTRILPSDDTSTPVQPSLFGPPKASLSVDNSERKLDREREDLSNNSNTGRTTPSSSRGTTPRRSGEGEGVGVSFSSSGSEIRDSTLGLPGDRDLEQPATSPRPRLALVPPPPDIAAVESLLSEIAKAAGGKFRPGIREGLQNVLCAMIETIAEVHRTPPAIELVGQQLARDPTRVVDVRGDPNTMLSVWLATPGAYLEALAAAHAFERDREERSAMVAESLKTLGWAKDTVH